MKRRIFIDWDKEPLGEVSDYKIARRLGVSRGTVIRARQERGIKAAGRPYGFGSNRDLSVDQCLEELD